MRATSCGLEVCIWALSEEEINKIENSLSGSLKYRNVLEQDTREIPFVLRLDSDQRELVLVSSIPEEGGFGDSKEIGFSISQEYYSFLKIQGIAAGARFFGGVGKLSLYAQGQF
jgi:hypothetical protein